MAQIRTVSRRSFLAMVMVGSVLLPGGAQARRGRRRMIVDIDPRDPARPIRPVAARPRNQRPTPAPDYRWGSNPEPAGRFVICPGNRRCPGHS